MSERVGCWVARATLAMLARARALPRALGRGQLLLCARALAPAASGALALSTKAGEQRQAELTDYIDLWTPNVFKAVGVGLGLGSAAAAFFAGPLAGAAAAAATALYWRVGLADMAQSGSSIRRNFPVLGNLRYILESVRPEIRQYLIEGDSEAAPFDRAHRVIAYQRAKGAVDSLPFGTRRDVYAEGYEYASHSMWPVNALADPEASRVTIGGPDCKQPYSAALLNVSGMSYGALSENAILALSRAAAQGNFYHNTGEGGMSRCVAGHTSSPLKP